MIGYASSRLIAESCPLIAMKVLVADDESIIRMGLKSMLQEMDHAVITARDGREALKKAIAYQPDVAVLDIQMPKTNGLQLAKALNKHFPLPIIFLTAFAQDELIDQATDLNVHGYLIKPVKSAELRAAIQIARKRFRDQERETMMRKKAETRLSTRKALDRAKEILIGQGYNEQTAYAHIQQTARANNQTMGDIAESIIVSRNTA